MTTATTSVPGRDRYEPSVDPRQKKNHATVMHRDLYTHKHILAKKEK